jgi:catechol 2,3-dioxygenase-like lactoylglutathione lyase family enzyme
VFDFARLDNLTNDNSYYPAFMKISLVAVGVSDLPKSVAFYRDKAGFDLQNQFGSLAFFSAGPTMLMLNAGLRRPGAPLTGAIEIVVTAESVTASYRELLAAGCNFVNEPREVTPGSWAATFTDPDGHWLTLFGPN